MKGHLFWIAVWIGVIFAGYLLTDLLISPPPVVRSNTLGQQEVVVPVSPDGHFYLDGFINGVAVRFMIDTGASYVSVGADFARHAGIRNGVPGYFSTANGTVEGRVVKNNTVRADALEISGLSIAVMPQHKSDALLGQNFLRHFELLQAAGTLRLRMRGEGHDAGPRRTEQR